MTREEMEKIIRDTPRWAPELKIAEEDKYHQGTPYGDFEKGDRVTIYPSNDTPTYWLLIWNTKKRGEMHWDNIAPSEFTYDMAKYFKFSRYVPYTYDDKGKLIILDKEG